MPKVSPNFDEEFKPVEPGQYLCKIIAAEMKYGREKGTPYISWTLETVDSPRKFFYSTPIEGRGAGMFKHFIHCAGDASYEKGDYDTDEVLGEIVLMELDTESYTGKDGRSFPIFKVVSVDPPSPESLAKLKVANEADIPF